MNDDYTRYVILLTRQAPFSEALIREHVEHLKRLDAAGQLVLCGPFKDYAGGMVILQVASREEADWIARADPFVREGVSTYELRTWELSCRENDHLGMG